MIDWIVIKLTLSYSTSDLACGVHTTVDLWVTSWHHLFIPASPPLAHPPHTHTRTPPQKKKVLMADAHFRPLYKLQFLKIMKK